ncbi:endonuclease/exonuclease/phosphatase family protein [Bacillus cereus group sp. BfR-BA-01347]|uniref:endonuclease/exonuclease/phosphatase family protein n=1 Tax=Bacillus cereus group sp. BfR-BA-01347 TaxID=2920310 RepID=UPI001F56B7D2|nr:endonuclease/exonuclease/phosphatase family protein [Bacillus cereus group sp. BfR-BA-01347]
MQIKVMTYNIHHGRGIDKQVDLYRIAEVIKKSEADIIGLNEVDKHFSKRSYYENQISWLAKQLNMHQAFSPSLSLKSRNATTVRQYGNALLSRYPIITKKSYPFHFGYGLMEGRSLLEVIIQKNKQLFQVYVTHQSLNPFLHKKQTDFIVNHLHKHSYPVIIMGDWNMKPGSRGWRKITREFQDVWHIAGQVKGYTYPSVRPRIRLDYIFVSRNLQVIEVEVATKMSKESDHLPLKATLSYY